MDICVRSDGTITQIGFGITCLDGTVQSVTGALADSILNAWQASNGGVQLVGGVVSQLPLPVIPSPTMPPDINGLINALVASPSIDQTTKDKLIAALKGQ